jgi:hypothetical protein
MLAVAKSSGKSDGSTDHPSHQPVVNAICQWARVAATTLPLVIVVMQAAVAWAKWWLQTVNLRFENRH